MFQIVLRNSGYVVDTFDCYTEALYFQKKNETSTDKLDIFEVCIHALEDCNVCNPNEDIW